MKINYSVKLETPALTAALGTIGKDINIETKIDSKGRPYFTAKQIKGILRERVKQLGNSYYGEEETNKIIEKYFGKEGFVENTQYKLRFSNLILSNSQKKKLDIRCGIRVNRKTKTAIDNSLFNYEMIPARSEFQGELEIKKFEDDEFKFIIACLFHLEYIGGAKSRGLGKVNIEIENQNISNLTKIIEDLKIKKIEDDEFKLGNLKKYNYQLKFKEDFILKGKEIGNKILIKDKIQGSAIRGAVIGHLLEKNISIDNLISIKASDAKNGEIYLASSFKSKYPIGGKTIYKDKVICEQNEIILENKNVIKLERSSKALLKEKSSEISTSMNKKTRSINEGMLFETEVADYEKIGTLYGTIEILEGLLEPGKEYEISIGRMKYKGFGKAMIKIENYEEDNDLKKKIENKILDLNKLVEKNKGNKEDEKIITFDFISDMILPFNEVNDITEEFKNLLSFGNVLTPVLEKTFVTLDKLGGYNIINNIRKTDEIIITSGSVLTYSLKNYEEILEELEDIEKNGLGLRRHEGFGEISICTNREIEDNEAKKEIKNIDIDSTGLTKEKQNKLREKIENFKKYECFKSLNLSQMNRFLQIVDERNFNKESETIKKYIKVQIKRDQNRIFYESFQNEFLDDSELNKKQFEFLMLLLKREIKTKLSKKKILNMLKNK